MARQQQSGDGASGGCLCGAVRYEARGELRPVVCCHCEQCRRSHGHFSAYTAIARDGLNLVERRGLAWYRSSEQARRGFCRDCGSSLFWDRAAADYVAIAAGTLDRPTGLATRCHIFVVDKGDYYEIADGLEQMSQGMG